MALKSKPSTAHEYGPSGQCIHCGMYRNVVEDLTHVCTKQRELEADGTWLNHKGDGH